MFYPNKLNIIAPLFRAVDDGNTRGHSSRLIYLDAFAVLTVARDSNGRFTFEEATGADPIGNGSVSLLAGLVGALDPDAVLCGFRLHDVVGSLVRCPRDSEREAEAEDPFRQLVLALGQNPIDLYWIDADGGFDTLKQLSATFDLPAEWDEAASGPNVLRLRMRLSARAETMWLAIVHHRLTGNDQWQALADFVHWKETSMAI